MATPSPSPLAAWPPTQPSPALPDVPLLGSPELLDGYYPPDLSCHADLSTSDLSTPALPSPQAPTDYNTSPLSQDALTTSPPHLLPSPWQLLLPHPSGCTPLTHTPVNTHLLASLLSDHPNLSFTTYLPKGLTQGFKVGYHGNQSPRPAPNLRSALARPHIINTYLTAECQAGHTAGPFPSSPLPNFVVNPLGAVPKKRSGKWHLIMHLSYHPGSSVNDGINNADFPLRYSTVYDAIDSIMCMGREVQMTKIDIKSAFQLCPVHPTDHSPPSFSPLRSP